MVAMIQSVWANRSGLQAPLGGFDSNLQSNFSCRNKETDELTALCNGTGMCKMQNWQGKLKNLKCFEKFYSCIFVRRSTKIQKLE